MVDRYITNFTLGDIVERFDPDLAGAVLEKVSDLNITAALHKLKVCGRGGLEFKSPRNVSGAGEGVRSQHHCRAAQAQGGPGFEMFYTSWISRM